MNFGTTTNFGNRGNTTAQPAANTFFNVQNKDTFFGKSAATTTLSAPNPPKKDELKCRTCAKLFPRVSPFWSANQLSKGKTRRCHQCIHGRPPYSAFAPVTILTTPLTGFPTTSQPAAQPATNVFGTLSSFPTDPTQFGGNGGIGHPLAAKPSSTSVPGAPTPLTGFTTTSPPVAKPLTNVFGTSSSFPTNHQFGISKNSSGGIGDPGSPIISTTATTTSWPAAKPATNAFGTSITRSSQLAAKPTSMGYSIFGIGTPGVSPGFKISTSTTQPPGHPTATQVEKKHHFRSQPTSAQTTKLAWPAVQANKPWPSTLTPSPWPSTPAPASTTPSTHIAPTTPQPFKFPPISPPTPPPTWPPSTSSQPMVSTPTKLASWPAAATAPTMNYPWMPAHTSTPTPTPTPTPTTPAISATTQLSISNPCPQFASPTSQQLPNLTSQQHPPSASHQSTTQPTMLGDATKTDMRQGQLASLTPISSLCSTHGDPPSQSTMPTRAPLKVNNIRPVTKMRPRRWAMASTTPTLHSSCEGLHSRRRALVVNPAPRRMEAVAPTPLTVPKPTKAEKVTPKSLSAPRPTKAKVTCTSADKCASGPLLITPTPMRRGKVKVDPPSIILPDDTYWCNPSPHAIASLPASALSDMTFEVGREGYGSIRFNHVDLSDPRCHDLRGLIVIAKRCVDLYPSQWRASNAMPPTGEALNRPAMITLEEVWASGNRGAGGAAAKLEMTLRAKACEWGATHVLYNQATGRWKFNVSDFAVCA